MAEIEKGLEGKPVARLAQVYNKKRETEAKKDAQILQILDGTVEGAALKKMQAERVGFNVANKINPSQRLKFMYDYNSKLGELSKQFEAGKLTPIPE